MQYFIAPDGGERTEVRLTAEDGAPTLSLGDRVLLYERRETDGRERPAFVAWGIVERLDRDGDDRVAHLGAVAAFRRRVPFSELRADPRRRAGVAVQALPAETFNLVVRGRR